MICVLLVLFLFLNQHTVYAICKFYYIGYIKFEPSVTTTLASLSKSGNISEKDRKIHIWAKFANVYDIYLLNMFRASVTLDDLQNENATRWVEIPHDYERLLTLDKLIKNKQTFMTNAKKNKDINISTGNTTTNINSGYSDNAQVTICVEYINKQNLNWPMMKGKENWQQFEIGDIIDMRDAQKQWNQGFIRNIIFKNENENEKDKKQIESVVVHSVGWHAKWVENVRIDSEDLAPRSTHCSGPFRANKWGYTLKPNAPLFDLPVTGMKIEENIDQ